MSGGVDSSVAAALLVQQGYAVTGMMLRLWNDADSGCENRCCPPEAMALARRVAAHLGIPFYVADAQAAFRQIVVDSFLQGCARGITPNPCFTCNQAFRWDYLLRRAEAMGIQYLATGHYARLIPTGDGKINLLRARDGWKDQSYVLSGLTQAQLAHTLLPLGEMTKPEVREKAREFGLPTAERADSQDLCFLGNRDYRSFLNTYAPEVLRPGPILNQEGQVVGEHEGLAAYTIGQRKGIRIAGPEPLYVIRKDIPRNTLIVGTLGELGKSELVAEKINWVSCQPSAGPFRGEVKIRYKSDFIPAEITPSLSPSGEEIIHVQFDHPLRDITPGQIAVFYCGENVIASGIIQYN